MREPRHLLTVKDLSKKEVEGILRRASLMMKKNPKRFSSALKGKTLAMLFAKPSTRTRVSFEVAMLQLGGHAIDLDFSEMQVSRGESIADTARVLSRYVDCIMARLFSHEHIEELAQNSTVPVINGLTDMYHPCQALGDMLTMKEKLGSLKGKRLVFLGDGSSNVCHSLINAAGMLGLEMVVSYPNAYKPRIEGNFETITNPREAVKGADVLYTDTWVSMGQEREKTKRASTLRPYQVNNRLLAAAKGNCIVMHCLPAHRGQEITDDAMDRDNSAIFDQAENRLHIQKSILVFLLK